MFGEEYVRDWLDVLVRGLHVIAAIGWIGSSFYFVLLDQSLRKPKTADDERDGVKGELWEVHGGGFYHVKKYEVAPPTLPDHLAWFKWEAYTTWLTGFALIVILYWTDAQAYMIDRSVADISSWAAVGISAGLLLLAWLIYDVACRVVKQDSTLAVIVAAEVVAAAWGAGELFSARAAWLQTGAMIGTIMAANVFFNIIPAHWELIRAKEAGRDPDPAPGIEAKRRSVHNNYFTLPVLLTMIAGHFGFLTQADNAWVVLVALMVASATARHFFNMKHSRNTQWGLLAVPAAIVIAVFVALAPEDAPSKDEKPSASTSALGKQVFTTSCGGCHTMSKAGATGTMGPNLDAQKPSAERVATMVSSGGGAMPPFASQLSKEEIDAVAAYVAKSTK